LAFVLLLATSACGYSNAAASPTSTFAATFHPSARVTPSVVRDAADIMSKRLSEIGVSGSVVAVGARSIDVSLTGVSDPVRVVALLDSPGTLYFRAVLCGANAASRTSGTNAASTLPTCASPYSFEATSFSGQANGAYRYPSTDPAFSSYPSTAIAADRPTLPSLVSSNGELPYARLLLGAAEVLVGGKTKVADETMIKSARPFLDSATKQWQIIFEFSAMGSTIFNAMATLDYGMPVAMELDGTVVSAPIIEARQFPGSSELSGNFTKARASFVAAELNSGPLPMRFTVSITRTK
jgi:preprotein translocase subunit SecD